MSDETALTDRGIRSYPPATTIPSSPRTERMNIIKRGLQFDAQLPIEFAWSRNSFMLSCTWTSRDCSLPASRSRFIISSGVLLLLCAAFNTTGACKRRGRRRCASYHARQSLKQACGRGSAPVLWREGPPPFSRPSSCFSSKTFQPKGHASSVKLAFFFNSCQNHVDLKQPVGFRLLPFASYYYCILNRRLKQDFAGTESMRRGKIQETR